MKILICQPKHEEYIETLEDIVEENVSVDYFLFPEGYLNSRSNLESAKLLAYNNSSTIISSLRDNNTDIAIVINSKGELVYERLKTESKESVSLNSPLYFKDEEHDINIGFLLCMELLKGFRDMPKINYGLIVQPIGVGMFSDEQFDLWIGEAIKIAKKFDAPIIGTSHSDGSYKNCGISIPISYCIDRRGDIVFICKNNVKDQIIKFNEKEIKYLSDY